MRFVKIQNGFTLIEVLCVVLLIGIAIASLVAANMSLTQANGAGADMSTAEFLIEQIRERTALVDFSGLTAFNGAVYSPPEDSKGNNITALTGFSQHITVEKMDGTDFTKVITGASNYLRITVTVMQNSKVLSSAQWIRANY